MKRSFVLVLLLALAITGYSSTWIGIRSQVPVDARVKVLSSDLEKTTVKFTVDGYSMREVLTPRGPAYVIDLKGTTPIQKAGAPDLPKMTSTLAIPDLAAMEISVVSMSYRDYENIDIAPSKGVITRDIDPSTVPYQYGPEYSTDGFFPGNITDTREPFIVRDVRGQTIIFNPFTYNPVTRVLRVYNEITLSVEKVSDLGVNPLVRTKPVREFSRDWAAIYANGFDNFDAVSYTPLDEYGRILVISYGDFMADMQPYVDWKNESGYPTEMVSVTDAGSTAAAIKTYITDYYNTNGLTFVLLVGDNAQVPTNQGGGLGGPSDNAYGYIIGNDHYQDIYIGRFSAENVTHVQTQVERTLDYEMNPQLLTDDWYTTVIGIGSDQGPGDDNEYDYQHIRNLQAQCLAYTYTMNPELFDGSQGGNDAAGNPSPSMVSTEVNNGAGLILYTGHGSETSWGTTGFSNSNVNALVNQDKLPFIWSVACVNGNFLNTTCFAEAWLRASQGGQPTGAVAFLGATINQSWNSPMEGEDEMVNVLTENNPTNIKRTFGGLSISGCMQMIEAYGSDGSNMADTWTIFGDPSLFVRTATPQLMSVTHDPTLFVGSTSLTVTCSVEGARATASLNGTILATGLISGGTINMTFPALQNPMDTVHLVVTAYNYLPDISDITVITPDGPYIIYNSNIVNDATGNNDQLVDYGEDILLTVAVRNLGVAATGNLDVKVHTSDPYVIQNDSTEAYGVVEPNTIASVPDAYHFTVSSNIPDGHSIAFQVTSVDGASSWSSAFSLPAHSPALGLLTYQVLDPLGNNNGRLDPGEAVTLKIFLENSGSSEAFNIDGNLVAVSPWITVNTASQSYGNLAAGQSNFNEYDVTVDPSAPEGQTAPFMLEISADRGIATLATFSLVIGKLPLLVVDYDGNANSGIALKSSADGLGLLSEYELTMPQSLDNYKSVFVCLGIYPDNHVLSSADGQLMKNFLDAGGRIYMEGGDTWKYDPQTPVHIMFHIMGVDDGGSDLGTLLGLPATFTEGMEFAYTGDNQYIDRILNQGSSWPIFKNDDPFFYSTIAYDGTTFRTIGSSSEFGGLGEGVYPSTKMHLLEEYLNFFGINIPALGANFVGYPTSITAGGNVNFTDFSSGGVTTWSWSFPGGTPATSAEKNPVVFYNTEGDYDVRLIIGNGITTDTLDKAAYIHVAEGPVGTASLSATIGCLIAPNPGNGYFRLDLSTVKSERVNVAVYNMIGSMVYRSPEMNINGKYSGNIDLRSMPDGVYIMKVVGESGSVTRRIIISK